MQSVDFGAYFAEANALQLRQRKRVSMRLICLCLLIVALQPLPGLAQDLGSDQRGISSYDLWLVRSQAITADLIKDSANLPPSERALLWARLAQWWWRDDPEKARSWMLKPIEMVEAVPNKENADERRQRLTTVRLLLRIVAPLDQKLSVRLVGVLTQDAEQVTKTERAANADGLIDAAISLVDSDPKRAAELGAMALSVGRPTKIQSLIFRLRPKDPKLSDALFAQTLALARQMLDTDLLNSLGHVAFPESRTVGARSTLPMPDPLKAELLRVYIAYLQANQINAANRNSVCTIVVSLIAPVLAEFDRLLPQQATIVRQSVNQCQALSPLAQQVLDDAVRDQPLNTIADLLKAAGDAQDTKVRTVYQFRAASLAKEQDDFDGALKILDSMSTESREFMGGSWESYRWNWAALSALRHFKSGDVYGMRLILNAVPTDLQPYAKMAFVDRLPINRDKDPDPTLEFLTDVRIGLRRPSLSDDEKSIGYFALLPLAIKFQPTEATTVLKEAVAALNRAEQAKDKHTGHNAGRGVSGAEFSKLFPASLLEMDDYAVKEAVSTITSPEIRVQVRLGLLSVCLERLRSSKQTTPKPEQPASKGE
jgi:hypothetical protein